MSLGSTTILLSALSLLLLVFLGPQEGATATVPEGLIGQTHTDTSPYGFVGRPDLRSNRGDMTWVATNHNEGFEVVAESEGLHLRSVGGNPIPWVWEVRLVALGRNTVVGTVPNGAMLVEGNRVEYKRGTVTEWYVNDVRGVEQGFTVTEPPRPGVAGRLRLDLELRGDLVAHATDGGRSLLLRAGSGKGRVVLGYSNLQAFDARGKTLAARMELRPGALVSGDESGLEVRDGSKLSIWVDDVGAVYPVTIDPVISRQVKTLTGSNVFDAFGASVSISGDTAVVGAAYGRDDAGAATGAVHVFERNRDGTDNWGEVKKLIASDAAAGDEFGGSVSISGDTVVVGAYLRDENGINSGVAYIFNRNQGGADNWGQVRKLIASDAATGDLFGDSVSISGDTVIVGAKWNADAGSFSGSAYVFSRNQGGADNWGQVKKLVASDSAAVDEFGFSVSISGDTVVVGAPGRDDSGTNSGAAYIFERNQGGADNWGQVKKVVAADPDTGDAFGFSVGIFEDRVVIGALLEDEAGADSGAAYIFERNRGGTDNWGQVRKLTAQNAPSGDNFGVSVAVDADTVVVGAPQVSGSAYAFSRNAGGTDMWGHTSTLKASEYWYDYFGLSVGISGNTVLVGSRRTLTSGAAFLFSNVCSLWAQNAKSTASDAAAGDQMGVSVAVSGNTAVVGAPLDDDAGADSGSVYVFERNQEGADNWGQVRKLTAQDAAGGDQFGYSVSISGDTIVVGSKNDDDAGSASGSAYIFFRNQGGADQWGQSKKLTVLNAFGGDNFGEAVGISGDTIVVGAPRTDRGAFNNGTAYVFSRNQGGADNWGQVREIISLDTFSGDLFGEVVAISGDTLIVGARLDDDAGSNSGSAYIFARNQGGADNWGQVKKLTAADATAGDEFGVSVAVTGEVALVGAHFDDDGGPESGSAYIFARNQGGTDIWGQSMKLRALDAAAGDRFGGSVFTDGNLAIIGAQLVDTFGADSGASYLFRDYCVPIYLPIVRKP